MTRGSAIQKIINFRSESYYENHDIGVVVVDLSKVKQCHEYNSFDN